MKGMIIVNERLLICQLDVTTFNNTTYHQKGPCCIIDEDSGRYDEHGKANKFIQLMRRISATHSGRPNLLTYHCYCLNSQKSMEGLVLNNLFGYKRVLKCATNETAAFRA